MSLLSVYLLGPFQTRLDDQVITRHFRTDKERSLLAFLMVESGRAHSRDTLAELIWPERPEGVARTSLRQALSGLRKALGDRDAVNPSLIVTNETIRFNSSSTHWLDVSAFTAHFQAILSHPHQNAETCPSCIQRLHEAVDLYRGDFLEAVGLPDSQAYQEWVVFQRERLFCNLLSAMQSIVKHYMQAGNYDSAQTYAYRYVNLAPLEEHAHQQLMQILALSGRRTAALEQYQRFRRILSRDLNIEPSPETTAIYDQIRSGNASLNASPTEPLSKTDLPVQLTSFVDRQNELNWFGDCLPNPVCRLITIVGMPGVGKTRLALQAVRENFNLFPDGVHYISLESAPSPAQMIHHIARALGVRVSDPGNPMPDLIQQVHPLKTMIILDNLEHLANRMTDLMDLLYAAPHIKLLVLAQQRLNFQAACIYEVKGLPYPDNINDPSATEYPAVQLFLARASRSKPGFTLNGQHLPDVIRICRLTDGLPLGIELAAAALRDFSPRQIADQLQNSLDILTTSMRDIPERHRSMRGCLSSAWDLLSDIEKSTLRRLSVFQGPFTLTAAQNIGDISFPVLTSLLEKSMLEYDPEVGYSLHPLIHLFSQEKLEKEPSESQNARRHFIQYYLDFLRQHESRLKSPIHRRSSLEAIEKNLDNIREAVDRAGAENLEEPFNTGLAGLKTYYETRTHKSNKECAFWKIELALQENPDAQIVIPVLHQKITGKGLCCGRIGCLEEAKDAIILENDRHEIIEANYQACQLTGYPYTKLITNRTTLWESEATHLPGTPTDTIFKTTIYRPDGLKTPVEISHSRLTQGGETFYVSVIRPAGEISETGAGSSPVSTVDPLTGLPNRSSFMVSLSRSLSAASQGARQIAILLIDLDDLSGINQNYGYSNGDLLLQSTSTRLKKRLRSQDVISRFGGDEFAVLLEDLNGIESLQAVARKILSIFANPFPINGSQVKITASIGICVYPGSGDSIDALITNADTALARAKQMANNSFSVYTP